MVFSGGVVPLLPEPSVDPVLVPLPPDVPEPAPLPASLPEVPFALFDPPVPVLPAPAPPAPVPPVVEPPVVEPPLVSPPVELPSDADAPVVVPLPAELPLVVDEVSTVPLEGSAAFDSVDASEVPLLSLVIGVALDPVVVVAGVVVFDAVLVVDGVVVALVTRRLTTGLTLKLVLPILGAAVPEFAERLNPELDSALPGEPTALKALPDDVSLVTAPAVAAPVKAVGIAPMPPVPILLLLPTAPFDTAVFPAVAGADPGVAAANPAKLGTTDAV